MTTYAKKSNNYLELVIWFQSSYLHNSRTQLKEKLDCDLDMFNFCMTTMYNRVQDEYVQDEYEFFHSEIFSTDWEV